MSADLEKLSQQLSQQFNNLKLPTASISAPTDPNLFANTMAMLNQAKQQQQQQTQGTTIDPSMLSIVSNPTSQQTQNTQALHEGLLGLLNQGFHDTGIPWLYSHLKGGIQGWYSAPGQNDPNPFENLWQGLQGAVQGFENPSQAKQNFAQQTAQTQAQMPNNLMKGLVGFNSAMVGDPITYLPGAAITKPVGWIARTTGVTPAMKYLGDLLGGSLKTGAEAAANPTMDEAALKGFDAATAAEKPLLGLPAPAAKLAETAAPKFADNSNLINDWAFGPGDHYNAFGGPAWNYNPITAENILKNIDPRVASKIEPMINGLMQGVDKPNILGQAGTMLPDVGKLRNEGASAVQAYSDLLGAKPLLGATAKGATKAAAEKSFSDTADQLANLTHTGEVPETGFKIVSNPANMPAVIKAGENLPAVIQNVSKELSIPEEAVAEMADDITKNTKKLKKDFGPYATSAWQKAVGAKIAPKLEKLVGPDGLPQYQAIQRTLNKAFSALPGTTKAFQNLYSRYFGNRTSGARWINQWLADTFKDTSPEQRAALIHAMESTPEGQKLADPALEALRQKIEPVMQQAFKDAQSKGLIKDTLDPAKFGVARYLPHIYKSGRQLFTNTGEHVTDNPFLRYGVDANKARGLKGTIKDLNAKAAKDANQPTFEDDALKVIGHYLHQINDAKAAHEFEDSAMGLYKGQFTKAGTMHPEAKSTVVLHSKNGSTVAMPKGESDILNNIGKKSEDSLLSKGFKKWTNGLNQMMFLSSPLIHVVNNLGFQSAMHDPAILKNMFKYIPEARHGIQAGSDMDRALKAGALNLSSEIGARGGSGKQLDQLVNAVDGKGIRNSGVGKAFRSYKQFTPDVEKAYRTAAFMRALDHGMSEPDAAKYVRSIFGGHIAPNTMSKAERAMNTIMPFGNWTKTALTSNAKNALAKPQAYEAIAQAMNSANQAETGHGMWDNKNPATIGTPFKDRNGNQVFAEPYFPAMDLMKLGKEFASDGIGGGSMNFMWSRANPILKTLTEWATKNENPFTNDPYSLYPLKTLSPNDPANAQGIFFGNKGPLVNPYVAAAAQNITLPGAQAGYDLTHLNQPGNGADLISSVVNALTGATTTAPKPQSAKAARYNQAQIKADLKKKAQILAQRGQ